MSVVNNDVFQKFQNAKKMSTRSEADGHDTSVEIREDEEQSVKLEEIIDLLVAAGYFRARIKGLSPFDKVVGGMTWCIESCSIDVDVDLLFQENSTIGQKISLTEKIVAILPKMKCPHSIEPHQIQGMDFIHIFPVIQWLVKRSMEFRQEQSAFVRAFAVNQFNKTFKLANPTQEADCKVLENINTVSQVYKTTRYYKRKNAPPSDIDSRIQITLLEYGDKVEHFEENRTKTQTDLLNNLTETAPQEDLNEEEKRNLAEHYALLDLEFTDGSSSPKNNSKLLETQLKILTEKSAQIQQKQDDLQSSFNSHKVALETIRSKQKEANKLLVELEQKESSFYQVKETEELLILNDSLSEQETQFREHCKKELIKLQNLIKEKKEPKAVTNQHDLTEALEKEMQEIRALRLKLAAKNAKVAVKQRILDDVPNRAELAQYQRRFLELYNQVAAKHKETKQYYTLYNTLEDTRLYMKKELSLLNSISENYPVAMESSTGKEEFLKQFQTIVDGVRQSRMKVENKLAEEKRKRDNLSHTLQGLVEVQRKYVAVLSQLTFECKQYEAMLAKAKNQHS